MVVDRVVVWKCHYFCAYHMQKDSNTLVPNRNNLTTLPDEKYKVEQKLG